MSDALFYRQKFLSAALVDLKLVVNWMLLNLLTCCEQFFVQTKWVLISLLYVFLHRDFLWSTFHKMTEVGSYFLSYYPNCLLRLKQIGVRLLVNGQFFCHLIILNLCSDASFLLDLRSSNVKFIDLNFLFSLSAISALSGWISINASAQSIQDY